MKIVTFVCQLRQNFVRQFTKCSASSDICYQHSKLKIERKSKVDHQICLSYHTAQKLCLSPEKWNNNSNEYVYSRYMSLFFYSIFSSILLALFGSKKANCDKEAKTNDTIDLEQKNLPAKSDIIKPLPSSPQQTLDNEEFSLKHAINLSRVLLRRKMNEAGVPGLSIAVSVNGKLIWSEGLGCSDVENNVAMTPQTVMRIASISKALTSVAVCKAIEDGTLELDVPIQRYVPSFPKKFHKGEEVTITTRQLMNHTAGIRHYKLASEKEEKKKKNVPKKEPNQPTVPLNHPNETLQDRVQDKRSKLKEILSEKLFKKKKIPKDEFSLDEYFIKEEFENVLEALRLFQDDDLLFKPGEGCSYSTHGWTLVSAVLEGATGKSFPRIMEKLFTDLGMANTYLDKDEPIIYKRSRFYIRDNGGRLKNAPYVNNSYKWAGGGYLSHVCDLINFGNVMLYSYQNKTGLDPKGYLKNSSMKEIWSCSPKARLAWDRDGSFGLGWGVVESENDPKLFARHKRFYASHTGGAIGASSVLLIMPSTHSFEAGSCKGVVVAIICNMQSVGLNKVALDIAQNFEKVKTVSKCVGTLGANAVYLVQSDQC